MSKHRVKFYGSSNLSTGYNLERIEDIFQDFNGKASGNYDINDILEFYNITLYLEKQCYLDTWNEERISSYNRLAKHIAKTIGLFFSEINSCNIDDLFANIEIDYYDDFWTLFVKYKVYTRIADEHFEKLLYNKMMRLSDILVHKILVNRYNEIIAEFMMGNALLCEVLLEEYLAIKNKNIKYYFPKSLDKEKLIINYIDSEIANLNYLELIFKSLSSNDLVLTDKTRLLAKKRYEKETEKLFKSCLSMSYGVEVSFSDKQGELVNIQNNNRKLCFTYSMNWFRENQEYTTLLIYNFIHVFGFVDNQIRFNHVHKINKMGLIAIVGIKGNKEYVTDMVYNQLNMAAQLQMFQYHNFMKGINLNLEEICKWFFKEYLATEFKVIGFNFHSPSQETTYLEKNRMIISEIDSILKQFKLWSLEKTIDQELLQMSSNHIVYNSIPSIINKKYVYPQGKEFTYVSNLLCSYQSPLHYISEDYNEKKFHELLDKNNLNIENFHHYQKNDIVWLLEHDYIIETEDGFLKIDGELIWIIDELYCNDVLSFHNLSKEIQYKVDILIDKKVLCYEDTLFSRPESDYLNYIFNKSVFSNGHDLRNKYVHGTQTLNEANQEHDYYIVLRMLILCILKINDEFCLEYKINNGY
ncbi:MAG: hypothetical protein RSD92_06255 [Erysipelotrichaceae bacterium]